MSNEVEEFKQLLVSSKKILVTSHISPDPDAVCSVLLLGTTLKKNFPNKNIEIVLEEHPAKALDFLDGYQQIKFQLLQSFFSTFQPELLIIADANTYDRVSRKDGAIIRNAAKMGSFKTVAIDHHQGVGRDEFAVFINNNCPATAEEVYHLLFAGLKLDKPAGDAEATMLGIISDSNRFKYADPSYRQTFSLVSDLISAGVSIEKLENRLERYSKGQLQAFSALIANIVDSGSGYTYSFVDETQHKSVADDDFKLAADIFTDQFLRNFEKNDWGFIVYPELASGANIYGASFRSLNGSPDVSELAAKLGGGGHKSAAGAKFEATSIEDALKKVEDIISDS